MRTLTRMQHKTLACLSFGLGSSRIWAHSVQLSAAANHSWHVSLRQRVHGISCGSETFRTNQNREEQIEKNHPRRSMADGLTPASV